MPVKQPRLPHETMLVWPTKARPADKAPQPLSLPLDSLMPALTLDPQRLLQARATVATADRLLGRLRQMGDPMMLATCLSSVAEARLSLGDLEGGRAAMEEAITLQAQTADEAGQGTSLITLARYHQHHGELAAAVGYYDRLAALSHGEQARRVRLNSMSAAAILTMHLGDDKEWARRIEETLPLMRREGDTAHEMVALSHLAAARQRLGQPEEAEKIYEQILTLALRTGDEEWQDQARVALCRLCFTHGDYDGAAQHEEVLLAQARERGDGEAEREHLTNLGVSYRCAGDYERAAQRQEEAIAILRREGDTRRLAVTLNNLGASYVGLGRMEESVACLEECLSLLDPDAEKRYVMLVNLAEGLEAIGQEARAMTVYSAALPLLRQAGERERVEHVMERLSVLGAQARPPITA